MTLDQVLKEIGSLDRAIGRLGKNLPDLRFRLDPEDFMEVDQLLESAARALYDAAEILEKSDA